MHRLARNAPIVVVLVFALVVIGMVVMAKQRTVAVESAPSSVPPRADLHIKNVEIEEQAGPVRWRLVADRALVYEQEGRTTLGPLSVVVHDRDRTWTIVAEEGDVHERESKQRDIEVRRNVVVTSSDGTRLETSVLRWDSVRRRLWTDAPVHVTRGRTVIRGASFELLTADETSTITRARLTVTREAGRT